MDSYENRIKVELRLWENNILSKTGFFEGISRRMQKKIDALLPEKFHETLTKAMEIAINSVLKGIDLIPIDEKKIAAAKDIDLRTIDGEVDKIIDRYKKIGAASGAGTGAGGVLAMTLDYPALIAVKLKMLQEVAQTFGYNIKEQKERIFILKVFLLAFSGDASRRKVYQEVKEWDLLQEVPSTKETTCENYMDWREFYTEYKESIEFQKMLQILPGIGAVVGAWANYNLVQELGDTARNAYRLRYFNRDKNTNQ